MGKKQKRYRKALEALVYIANLEQRHYWALKALYFADKEHLSRYGRQIYGDTYQAMEKGPVPSLAYDIVKFVRGDGFYLFENPDPSTAIDVPDNRTIAPLRKPDLGQLSKSDIECLDSAYQFVKDLTFGQLKAASHDEAYKTAEENDEIETDNLILSLKDGKEILEYVRS
jgi:hypothetical protein